MKKIIKYLRLDLILIIISLLLTLIYATCLLFNPLLIGKAIDVINQMGEFKEIKPLIYLLLINLIIIFIAQYLSQIVNNHLSYNLGYHLRSDAFKKLHKLPISYYDNNQSGKIINIIINDTDQFVDSFLLFLTQFASCIFTIIGIIIIMLFINYVIAAIVILLTPLSLFVATFISKKTYKYFKEQTLLKANETSYIDEMVTSIKVVKNFNYEEKNIEKFNKLNEDLSKISLKAVFYSSLVNPTTRFVNAVIYASVCIIGAYFVVKYSTDITSPLYLSIGSLTSLLAYANQYTKPFNEISGVIAELQNGKASLDHLFKILEEDEEKEDYHIDNIVIDDIKFNHVDFSYHKDHPLIKDLSFNIKKGTHVAIVGASGAGKTTLINLLMRFYDVNSGDILINEERINDIKKSGLRQNYGMVLQDTWIRNMSIYDNIKVANPLATKEEIIDACIKTNCDLFIKKLPNGYDTIINEDGMLSTGQKQLLMTARIMLKNPHVLILDEATSNIDTVSEQKIAKVFNKLMEGKTSFIVAHRLSTIENADIILVMKDGNVVEMGNHIELINKHGVYYELYNAQFND